MSLASLICIEPTVIRGRDAETFEQTKRNMPYRPSEWVMVMMLILRGRQHRPTASHLHLFSYHGCWSGTKSLLIADIIIVESSVYHRILCSFLGVKSSIIHHMRIHTPQHSTHP